MKRIFDKISIALIAIMLIFTACESESDFLSKSNPNQVTRENFFETAADAQAAVNAAYAPLQSGNLYNNQYFNMFDVGIEMKPNSNMPPSWHISTYSFDGSHNTITQVWRGLYQIVSRSNFAIEEISLMEDLDQSTKERLLGEAHFLRAWAYFDLVFHWGRVPLHLKLATSSEETSLPRAESELDVYNQVISDLELAKSYLPASYEGENIGRATKGAATAYLGKVYLYMASPGVALKSDGYSAAEAQFNEVITSGNYELVDDYLDNFTWFNENNEESIFELQSANVGGYSTVWGDHTWSTRIGEGTNRARTFGYLTWFNAYMNPGYINRFPDEDPRLRYTAYGPPTAAHPDSMRVFGGIAYNRSDWCARKYERYDYIPANEENGDSPINFRIMRYADVLLMHAEALIEQNKVSQAIPFINQVRQRASVNMPALSTTMSQSEAREALRNERLWEFGLEQIRMKDVIRWGADVAEQEYDISGIEAFDYSTHRYFPIPQSEIDFNQSLTNADQNPGY